MERKKCSTLAPHIFVGVAQLVEHSTHKAKVASSILAVDTIKNPSRGFLSEGLQNIAILLKNVYTLATVTK